MAKQVIVILICLLLFAGIGYTEDKNKDIQPFFSGDGKCVGKCHTEQIDQFKYYGKIYSPTGMYKGDITAYFDLKKSRWVTEIRGIRGKLQRSHKGVNKVFKSLFDIRNWEKIKEDK